MQTLTREREREGGGGGREGGKSINENTQEWTHMLSCLEIKPYTLP